MSRSYDYYTVQARVTKMMKIPRSGGFIIQRNRTAPLMGMRKLIVLTN